jgi:uncharacterized protein (TIGR00290 family)
LCRTQELRYRKTEGDEVEDLERLLRAVQEKYPDVRAVCSGAIASNYQRLRVENVCSRLGLVSLAYLWKQDQAHLLQQMVMNSKTFFSFLFFSSSEPFLPMNQILWQQEWWWVCYTLSSSQVYIFKACNLGLHPSECPN